MTFRHTALGLALAALAGAPAALAQNSGETPEIDPCTAGFVQFDTNGDGLVTEQEVAEASAQAFELYDADDSGELTPGEYIECGNARAGQSAIPADRTEANLSDYDTSGDDMLDEMEFMRAAAEAGARAATDSMEADEAARTLRLFLFVPADRPEMDVTMMSPEEIAARAAMTFEALDSDDDAKLGPAEWAETEALKNDIADVLNMQFDSADTDSSGTLSPEEYASFHQWQRRQAEARAEEAGADTEAGAPVVYFRYPEPM